MIASRPRERPFAPYLNSDALRNGFIPCETNPETGGLSRTVEPYHARATVTVGQMKGSLRHVCHDCAHTFHQHQKLRHGVSWE
jgi:hypothetical protein